MNGSKIVRHGDDYPASWSLPYVQSKDKINHWPWDPKNPKKGAPLSNGGFDLPIGEFNDAMNAQVAVEHMRNFTKNGTRAPEKPFFLAVGFHRPHIPYIYPKQFDAFYPNESIVYPPVQGFQMAENVPVMAPHDWSGEGSSYGDLNALGVRNNLPHGSGSSAKVYNREYNWSTMATVIPHWKGKEMKRSYYSCISYIDHLIGMLLDEVRRLGLYDETTIFFAGDHGYKLGEHTDWFKHDNFEDSVRIPTIIKPAKGLLPDASLLPPGSRIAGLVEEADIYPSLLDLHGFEVPAVLEGTSFVPLLQKTGQNSKGKSRAFSQYPHFLAPGASHRFPGALGSVMGYSMRTDIWRYTEWAKFACGPHLNDPLNCTYSSAPDWENVWGIELYDHRNDTLASFGAFENVNLAYKSEYSETVRQLSQELHTHWQGGA
eukprot:UC1_evm4s2093